MFGSSAETFLGANLHMKGWKKQQRKKHQGKVSTRNRAERNIQMKKYIHSIQCYTHKGCYMPGAGSPASAKIQVIQAAVTASSEHGHCDTAVFFHRTSQIILPWSPSKPEGFCPSPTACPCSASFCAAASTSDFQSSRAWSFLNFEPLPSSPMSLAPPATWLCISSLPPRHQPNWKHQDQRRVRQPFSLLSGFAGP